MSFNIMNFARQNIRCSTGLSYQRFLRFAIWYRYADAPAVLISRRPAN